MTFRELARGVEIFDRYVEPDDSISCGHDELFVCGISPEKMAAADVAELTDLGWFWGSEDCWEHFT